MLDAGCTEYVRPSVVKSRVGGRIQHLGSSIQNRVGGWNQPARMPPSTGMTVPVIHDEASESRKAITAATSSG